MLFKKQTPGLHTRPATSEYLDLEIISPGGPTATGAWLGSWNQFITPCFFEQVPSKDGGGGGAGKEK